MKNITELVGASHGFTLTDGSTFRILAHETVSLKDGLISEDIRAAEAMGLIWVREIPVVVKTKKSGGVE